MTLMSHITPTLDELFMESLKWADSTYAEKHKADDPATLRDMYYPNLSQWPTSRRSTSTVRKSPQEKIRDFARRNSKRTMYSIGIYALSTIPTVGRFVYPAASFWAFRKAVGDLPAAVIFGAGLILPKRFMVMFFQSFYSSRGLMRELLRPYFKRIHFTPEQKRRWYFDRDGVLFGFALGFYYILRIPFIGILMYGIAEASTAYLITKITDPPPPPPADVLHQGNPGQASTVEAEFTESQTKWHNKKACLSLPVDKMDLHNAAAMAQSVAKSRHEHASQFTTKRFT
ncbi:hypothetical protein KEM56_003752 [Ascosphaera pollenicola]|nr:hypothetical protein KEM56_003752 [Ascosphaera pollenicola]